MNNLQEYGWNLRDLKYIEMPEDEVERYRLQPGDLLFNRTNSKELVGKCEVFSEPGVWVFASYLIRVRLDTSKLLPRFAADFLSTRAGRLQIDRVSRQIIGMTNINAEELKEILIPVPPSIGVQQALVNAMDHARQLRAQKLQQSKLLLDGLNEFLLKTLDLKLSSQDQNTVFAVRMSELGRRKDAYSNQSRFRRLLSYIHRSPYQVSSLGDLATRIFSGTTPLAKGEAYVRPPEGVRFVRSGKITDDGKIDASSEVHIAQAIHNGIMKRSQLQKGDLLVAIVGATIGAVGVYTSDEPANINQAIAAIRLEDTSLSPEYACLYLRSELGQSLLDYFKRPVARANLNLEEIGEIPIIVPSRAIQAKIVDESHRRRDVAHRLELEAEEGWKAAKEQFEHELLGAH